MPRLCNVMSLYTLIIACLYTIMKSHDDTDLRYIHRHTSANYNHSLIGLAWVRSVFWQKSGCLRILLKWAIKQRIYLNLYHAQVDSSLGTQAVWEEKDVFLLPHGLGTRLRWTETLIVKVNLPRL